MYIRIVVEGINVDVKVNKNTNFGALKEALRDTLTPMLANKNQPWGKIIERIRDEVGPILNK